MRPLILSLTLLVGLLGGDGHRILDDIGRVQLGATLAAQPRPDHPAEPGAKLLEEPLARSTVAICDRAQERFHIFVVGTRIVVFPRLGHRRPRTQRSGKNAKSNVGQPVTPTTGA